MKYAVVSFHAECLGSGKMVPPGSEIDLEDPITSYDTVLIGEGILVPVTETAAPQAPEEVKETSE